MAEILWPWLAIAGLGALHGLNPASGWACAAAWGVRAGDRSHAWQALLPIAAGHAASVACFAGAVALGAVLDRARLVAGVAVLLAILVVLRFVGRIDRRAHAPVAHAGVALWSFAVATAHGSGSMLVPALAPLCGGAADGGTLASAEPFALAIAAVLVHAGAMLAVTGAVASGSCRMFRQRRATGAAEGRS